MTRLKIESFSRRFSSRVRLICDSRVCVDFLVHFWKLLRKCIEPFETLQCLTHSPAVVIRQHEKEEIFHRKTKKRVKISLECLLMMLEMEVIMMSDEKS